MGASLAAASRDPVTPAAAPPRRAPVGKVEAAPLTPPQPNAAAPDTPPPDVPAAAPLPPSLDGVRQATAPTPPPVAPPPAPAVVPLPQGAPVAVAFADGSASLPDAARTQLRTLAERRAGRPILVAGYGSAAEGDTAGQSRALPLAWERAGAIAGALQAAGVPANALSVSARATGQGGVARIAE
jgi:outer membrane protein OmpA-like peptidoglycan-associated protein